MKRKLEPEGPGLSEGQRRAFEAIRAGRNVLVCGQAGTGKSHLIDAVCGADRKVMRTAMSGVAAMNVRGVTLHSYLGIGTGQMSQEQLLTRLNDKKAYVFRKRWRETRTLIVDECSMLDARLFGILDQVGRRLRRAPHLPYGGMQLVLMGDFLQAVPIPSGTGDPGDGDFLFESPAFGEAVHEVVVLDHNFRQSGDPELQGVLSDLRRGVYSEKTVAVLQRCADRPPPAHCTMLFSTKQAVGAHNAEVVAGLTQGRRTFKGSDFAKTEAARQQLGKQCQAPQELTLAVGAHVMLLKNLNVASGLVNGATGEVVDTGDAEHDDAPLVRFTGGLEVRLPPEAFEIEVQGEVVARRTQVPLCPAYAISIHKSQGLTLDSACVSLRNLFSPNLLYVAISRVRSLDGLALLDFDAEALRRCTVDRRATDWYEKLARRI